MKGIKTLLNHQKENGLISEKAYNNLKKDTDNRSFSLSYKTTSCGRTVACQGGY